LLVNPFIDAMVIETSEVKVIREGLAFDRCEVAVVTNLGSGDHMGQQYVDDRDMVAKAIRAPVDVVLSEGCAVLNAGEPEVAAMAEKCRGRIVYFAPDGNAAPLADHLAKGGLAVFVSEGGIVAAHGPQLQRIIDLDRLRSPPGAIRQGLESSREHTNDALYHTGDKYLLVTPWRNSSALHALLRVMESSFPNRRRHAAIEVPSDWRPQDAVEISGILRESFATLTIVIAGSSSPTIENLCANIHHPALRREKAWAGAMDRIIGEVGPSDFIFVGPSERAGSDQANSHCSKTNMVRLG
jgi:cyanophycin synthetase